MDIYVHKFGGASLKDASSIQNVSRIIQKQNKPAIIVVSAMGKTTNALENVVKAAFFKKDNPDIHLEQLKQYHSQIIQQLFSSIGSKYILKVENRIQKYWDYIEKLIHQPILYPFGQFYDQIVSVGEIISSIIVSEYLHAIGIEHQWIDIRQVLVTDHQWRSANINFHLSEKKFIEQVLPQLQSNHTILTQGFIAGTSSGFSTTLGREGSDYTAALLAFFSNAREVTIWKDVDGVLNADPRYFKNPQKIDELSYYDAIEMTYYGATVIHPKTIQPLQHKNIPLFVKSFTLPNVPGTIIHQPQEYKKITTYSYLPQQILISLQSKEYSFFAETHIHQVFQIISNYGIKINLMQNTALNFSICINYDETSTPSFIQELQKHFRVLFNNNVGILTIRNYLPYQISYFTEGKEVLLEQRTRHNIQLVIRDRAG